MTDDTIREDEKRQLTDEEFSRELELFADSIADDLHGMPLYIDRDHGEPFVFVSSKTYHALQHRIFELEERLTTPEQREVEQACFDLMLTRATVH